MSFFGVDLRNAVAIGLGGIATLFSGSRGTTPHSGSDLVLEDGSFFLLEDGTSTLLLEA